MAHEKLSQTYREPSDTEWALGFDEGIVFSLSTLGIKIEGVNA
ncbi:hypothetical protein [Paenibacillus motobuensis]|uniref:Uncharacterized protein n=1 Tax=Paenibacillus motobuensis TaxID=295324 RepID=A0ABP3IBR1_9BACL